jgi:hypothetical protein
MEVQMGYADYTPPGVLRLCRGPWTAMAIGGAGTLLALVIQKTTGASVLPLALGGVVAAGVSVAIRPRDPGVLLAAAVCGFVGAFALPSDWDSIRMLIFVLAVLSGVCTILVVMPQTMRRIVFSILIICHFGAIGTAAFNVEPKPWMVSFLYGHLTHYYLEFVYLTNAYHFYAPEPGPGLLIKFLVKYDDGTSRWFVIPNRDSHPWLLNYQRRLSVAEGLNGPPNMQQIPENVLRARMIAGQRDGIPFYDGPRWNLREYSPAAPYTKRILSDYARHVALTVKNPDNPDASVVGIKIYRVTHRLPLAKEIKAGVDPAKPWFYQPYYLGEYDANGELKNPDDPYLYWLIPITNTKNPGLSLGTAVEADDKSARNQDADILDCLEKHSKLPTSLPAATAESLPH